MLNKNQKFGIKAEIFAAKLLRKRGYKIIKQNYRTKFGEIDIIAKEKDTIVFVEVKARSNENFGNPKLGVNKKKQKQISMVALYYLKTTNQSKAKARFDVVSFSLKTDTPKIEIIKNAFELAYS